jgi:hypothetical protein
MIFDPYDEDDTTPVAGSLADDVADIYLTLRGGLDLVEAGKPRGAALWEWKFGFDEHWGRHAAHALSAVHALNH